jgi:hypothetical protein
LRGKPWSVDEERQLRRLLEEGKSLDEISKIMGKTRTAVKGKFFNLGLNSLIVATEPRKLVAATTATTTSPAAPVPAPMLAPASASTPTSVTAPVSGVDLKLPQRLSSVEEKLRVLDAALVALEQPGLSHAEVSRLHNIIQGVKIYQELFAKYVDYRGLEAEVLELRKQLASENAKGANKESSNVSR